MHRNIILGYFIIIFQYSWFWLGIWAIYYSSFGGYWVVGLLETIMIVVTILSELPTGVIGDIIGKRKAIIIGLFLSGLSTIWLGLAPNLVHAVLSLVLMNIGGAFISGSFDALIYDTLIEYKKENLYEKILGNNTSIRLIAFTLFGIVGGYLATIDIRIPFILNGIGLIISAVLSYFLREPIYDTEKYNLSDYIEQTKEGVYQLFRSVEIKKTTILLLTFIIFPLIMWEGFNDILILDYGFKNSEILLGIFAAGFTIAGAIASYLYPRIIKNESIKMLFVITTIYGLTILFSPFVFLYGGAMLILIRSILGPLIENIVNAKLNRIIESKYRATALSTFNMIGAIPYAILIYLISYLADFYPSYNLAGILGVIMLIVIIIVYIWNTKTNSNQSL